MLDAKYIVSCYPSNIHSTLASAEEEVRVIQKEFDDRSKRVYISLVVQQHDDKPVGPLKVS